jgi:hypothetical protein
VQHYCIYNGKTEQVLLREVYEIEGVDIDVFMPNGILANSGVLEPGLSMATSQQYLGIRFNYKDSDAVMASLTGSVFGSVGVRSRGPSFSMGSDKFQKSADEKSKGAWKDIEKDFRQHQSNEKRLVKRGSLRPEGDTKNVLTLSVNDLLKPDKK